ncbi:MULTISPECIES: hypothetical protein [Vibrio]|uniref:hypothetical protein n=1 Tax=Vibrio TaxID=662 RepID=UPI0010BD98DA|nr:MULTISPECIES: hypothetical protein [Vibrio]KAB0457881.1 hypothetical protein F7Q89_20565 [Vibrio kanaloae]TKE92988.1 hypothetical protein FCV53_05970 [Vibrio sp. F12]
MEMIQEILALPVIIQGALGSALFALCTWLLRFAFNNITIVFSKFNNELKIEQKNAELVGLYYEQSGRGTDSSVFLVWCIFHGLAHISQAAIWLVLGQMFGEVIYSFVYVGYLGALYYLYRAGKVLPTKNNEYTPDEIDQKINELEKELDPENI